MNRKRLGYLVGDVGLFMIVVGVYVSFGLGPGLAALGVYCLALGHSIGKSADENTARLRFAGDHAEGLEFVEAENDEGESVNLGTWVIDDGYHFLEIEGVEYE